MSALAHDVETRFVRAKTAHSSCSQQNYLDRKKIELHYSQLMIPLLEKSCAIHYVTKVNVHKNVFAYAHVFLHKSTADNVILS